MRIPLPESLREDALKRNGDPVAPVDAATIVVVRDGAEGLEGYLLRRQPTMAFAPGMHVFPGGKVQRSDRDELPWVGPPAESFAEAFAVDVDTARGLVVAAVRETFEESGLLLAGPSEDAVVADTAPYDHWRVRLDAGEVSFATFLAEHGLVLRADLLGAWAHWVTPAFEPRRYDTRFFVAVAPEGQHTGTLPGEADRAAWVPLGAAVADVRAGRSAMLPPTLLTSLELADLRATDVLEASAARKIIRIEPQLVDVDGQLWLENPLEAP